MSPPGEAFVAGAPQSVLVAAGALIEASVFGSDGAKLGKVADVMITAGTGTIAYAVLAFGGVMGIGERLHAVPWGSITVDPVTARLSVAVDRATLDKAPGFDKDSWPDDADHELFPAA